MKLWFANIISQGKAVTVVFSIVAGAAGGISVYNNWIVASHDAEQEIADRLEQITEIRQSLDSMQDTLATLSFDVRKVNSAQKNMQTDFINYAQASENLRQYLINKAIDKDEIIEIIQIWEAEKKNSD